MVVLSLLLSAAPCERAVLLPLEPVATSSATARRHEDAVRKLLVETPALCVETRADTVKRLLTLESRRPAPCRDLSCATEQLRFFDAQVLVQGLVLGVGGKETIELTITRPSGTTRALGEPSELPALLSLSSPPPPEPRAAGVKWPSFVLAGAALGAFGGALGLGIAAKERERALSLGMACAQSAGPAFATCLDGELGAGKTEATVANVLFAVSGALLVAATVFFFVEFP